LYVIYELFNCFNHLIYFSIFYLLDLFILHIVTINIFSMIFHQFNMNKLRDFTSIVNEYKEFMIDNPIMANDLGDHS
jgi:hypothetical protein